MNKQTSQFRLDNTLKQYKLICTAAVLLHSVSSNAQEVVAPEQAIAPPSIQTTDRNFVNVASGEVSLTLEDVAIGSGGLSLSHTIGTHSSDFVNYQSTWGPVDKFRGGLMKKHWRAVGDPNMSNPWSDDIYVASYFDHEGSLDFEIHGAGSYSPISEPGSSLTYSNGKYIVTKPNGTVVEVPASAHLLKDNTYEGTTAGYSKITYPNGFTINVNRRHEGISSPIESVTTNTGLMLKYVYDIKVRNIENDNTGITWPSTDMEKMDWIGRRGHQIPLLPLI